MKRGKRRRLHNIMKEKNLEEGIIGIVKFIKTENKKAEKP